MNIDIVLFAGRIVLVALLYIFLFAVMKTGVGLVRGQRRDSAIWTIDVDKGPRGIRGIHVDMLGPVIVGRSPSSDICINEPFVSASHARFSLQGPALIIEDLNSLNGTLVNGRQLVEPATLREGDEVQIGDVVMKVNRRCSTRRTSPQPCPRRRPPPRPRRLMPPRRGPRPWSPRIRCSPCLFRM